MLHFPHAMAALADHDSQANYRSLMWDNARSAEDIQACSRVDEASATLVQAAYYLDTRHINRLSSCMNIAVLDIRKNVIRDMQAEKEQADSIDLPGAVEQSTYLDRLITEFSLYIPVGA